MTIKIDPKLLEKIKSGKGYAEVIEFTPEKQAKLKAVSTKILEILTAETTGPAEAYSVIITLKYGLEQCYGIQGFFGVPKNETEQ